MRLMTVPASKRDDRWLEESLQAAIQLELSTIPPYLYAAWSIDAGHDPSDTRPVIVGIAVEEMLHMGIACNLLASIGGQPRIVQVAPTYPAELPKDIHQGLLVGLEPLSRELLLRTFMAIEEPSVLFVEDPEFVASGSTLIGEFYDQIQQRLDSPATSFSTARQVDLQRVFFMAERSFIIESLDDVRAAVDLIKRQGEGTAAGPFEVSTPEKVELAHFYQFGEIAHGHRLTRTSPFTYTGQPVDMPAVRPVTLAASTQPEAAEFNRLYSDILRDLDRAWDVGGPAGGDRLEIARDKMFGLGGVAEQLISQGIGPPFILVDESGTPVTPPPVGNRFARVKEILDAAVGPRSFGAHGPFWRGQSRDQFVQFVFANHPLVVVGNGRDSNLIKALRGQKPFGRDIGTPGAFFRRMPAGRPPVAPADVDFIEQWINDGCPDAAPVVFEPRVSLTTGAFRPDPSVHLAYFRDLDNWSAFHPTPEVRGAIDKVFGAFTSWMPFARDHSKEAAWVEALADDAVVQAIAMLSARRKQTVEAHYGVPVPLLALLDGFERFGSDGLPDDPLRPDERHNMSEPIMWFVLSSFADACVQLEISTEFWLFFTRPILCGLLNDGLFRGRFPVQGFQATPEGQMAVFQHVQNVADADLRAELRQRFVDAEL
jgi:Ferritin-like